MEDERLNDIRMTPLEVVANVSRVVTRVVDRVTGGRVEVPLMVASAAQVALKGHGISSRVMFGSVAWVEVLQDHTLRWAGCWGDHFSFWVATEYGEVVDLNSFVQFRKPASLHQKSVAIASPPLLWCARVPKFYRYVPQGVAELELTDQADQIQYQRVLEEVREKCGPEKLGQGDLEFPNEPILCPDQRLLDDSKGSWKEYDRVLAVRGIPEQPF
jgi:hypothetical protein